MFWLAMSLSCFPGCHVGGDIWAAEVVRWAALATLVAGGVIMRRWRELLVVASVSFLIIVAGDTVADNLHLGLFNVPILAAFHLPAFAPFVAGFVTFLAIAAAVHALKRAVLWLTRYRGVAKT